MAADTFYFDASVQIDVSRAFSLLRPDVLYPSGPGCPVEDTGAKDDVWLPVAGEHGWVVIMRDKRIRRRPRERQALQDAGVRAFCLTGGGNYTKWQIADLLIRSWGAIEEAARAPGPYIHAVTQGGLRAVQLPESQIR